MPAITPSDLNQAKQNTDFIDRFANSTELSTIDRLSRPRITMEGLVADLNAVAAITQTGQNRVAAEAAEFGAQQAASDAIDASLAALAAGKVFDNANAALVSVSPAVPVGGAAWIRRNVTDGFTRMTAIKRIGAGTTSADWEIDQSFNTGVEFDWLRRLTSGFDRLFTDPNAWADDTFVKSVAGAGVDSLGYLYAKAAPAVGTVSSYLDADGRPVLRLQRTTDAASNAYWTVRVPMSVLGLTTAGQKFSLAVRLRGGTVNGASSTRVIAKQINAAGAEVMAARVFKYVPTGTVAEGDVQLPAISLSPDALGGMVDLTIDQATNGCVLDFDLILIAPGSNAEHRPGPSTFLSLLAVAWKRAGTVLGPQEMFGRLQSAIDFPNLVNNKWATTITQGTGSAVRETVTIEGKECVKVFFHASSEWILSYPASAFPSGKIALAATLVSRYVQSLVGPPAVPNNGRVIVMQRNGANAEVAGTRKTYTFAAALPMPATVTDVIDKHVDTSVVWFYLSANNGAAAAGDWATYADAMLSNGTDTNYRPLLAFGAGGAVSAVNVSTTGSDTTGTGTAGSPFRTFDRALQALGGAGMIFLQPGIYGPEMRITPSLVTGRVQVFGRRNSLAAGVYDYPLIRMATSLTGITKTAGRTRVYQATVAGLPALADFQWAYQDGVADPRTLILDEDREPEHRGRTHRLQGMCSLIKTDATTLAAALSEIDADGGTFTGSMSGTTLTIETASGVLAPGRYLSGGAIHPSNKVLRQLTGTTGGAGTYEMSIKQDFASTALTLNDPKAFIDSGILYFAIAGGGDATAANIYVDAAVGLVGSGAVRGSAGVLDLVGIQVRHGGVDLRPFADAYVDELVVIGAQENAVDYNSLTFGFLETAKAGSQRQLVGDGLNGHLGAKLEQVGRLYTHDNWDDGFSDHEGCEHQLSVGGVAEFCGGGGIVPAYGAGGVPRGFTGRYNQQRVTAGTPYKSGSFYVTGSPSQATPPETGFDTRAKFVGCRDIGSRTSFADDFTIYDGARSAYAELDGCESVRPITRAFNVWKIRNCRTVDLGSATARKASTIVENGTVVT